MHKNEISTPRINLQVPLDVSIRIDKESDKRKITRTQYIREAINEKLDKTQQIENDQEFYSIQESLKEIKIINLAILDKLNISK